MNIKKTLLRLILAITTIVFICIFALIVWFMAGVGPDPIVSNDIAELRKMINIDIPATQVTWEVVSWPDKTNTFPPPQDVDHYAILAYFTPPSHDWFNRLTSSSSNVWILPSIVRPWLPEPFKQKMQTYKAHNVETNGQGDCKAYATTTVKSNREIHGFVCQHEENLLLYLTVYGAAPNDPSISWE